MGRTITNVLLLLIAGLLGAHLFVVSHRAQAGRYQWVEGESKRTDHSVVLDTATGWVYTRSSITMPAGVVSVFEVYDYSSGRDSSIQTLNPFTGEHNPKDWAEEGCLARAHPGQDAFEIIDSCHREGIDAKNQQQKQPPAKPGSTGR